MICIVHHVPLSLRLKSLDALQELLYHHKVVLRQLDILKQVIHSLRCEG